jgi:hypothetical protein
MEFVNGVRAAQSRPPLDRLDSRGTLEAALGCRLEPAVGVMRFTSPGDADAVAASAGLRLGSTAGTVELPPAIKRFARLLAADAAGADLGPEGDRRAAVGAGGVM